MLEVGVVKSIVTKCEICRESFEYDLENRYQYCPHCGVRNYRENIIGIYPETFRREK
jgi:Zn finger protein HypA/HybF involved in hydrogenase expression